MTIVPPSSTPSSPNSLECKILAFRTRAQDVKLHQVAHSPVTEDQMQRIARLEAELVLRTSLLKTENDDLRGRVEVLERCLKIITDNLVQAKELLSTRVDRVTENRDA